MTFLQLFFVIMAGVFAGQMLTHYVVTEIHNYRMRRAIGEFQKTLDEETKKFYATKEDQDEAR